MIVVAENGQDPVLGSERFERFSMAIEFRELAGDQVAGEKNHVRTEGDQSLQALPQGRWRNERPGMEVRDQQQPKAVERSAQTVVDLARIDVRFFNCLLAAN